MKVWVVVYNYGLQKVWACFGGCEAGVLGVYGDCSGRLIGDTKRLGMRSIRNTTGSVMFLRGKEMNNTQK